ncbi:hypothetical protein GA830_15220 [Mesorhizobium sp. NBSH29]|uniref:hypothetical protein n=1 Tax=Mesorhizobium sp. NBSH29 TaxID=2654249 RepID=UPI0018969189|nr:hypothetical protein [Mesorhizobium sp. NBSH29]QPC87948.1 hypothetical protein GA830_15220 [Mesorhizobium sp. NBSH29]
MKCALLFAFLPLLALSAPVTSAIAADESDKTFFHSVEGEWAGPGEIIAGKYKGTKFNCTFTGATPAAKAGMSLDGACRVGVFTQKMSASIERAGRTYKGKFMDGAAGKGLDVIAGNVDGDKVILSLNRAQLKGAMLARLPDNNTLNVTISVRVGKQMVPVIGMGLKRIDSTAVGSIAKK